MTEPHNAALVRVFMAVIMSRRFVLFALAALLLWATPAAAQFGAPINLEWDATSDPDVEYLVYVGTASGTYVHAYEASNETTFSFDIGVVGKRYYFVVVAVGPTGDISPLSNEVTAVVQAQAGSATPGGGTGDGTSTGGGSTGGSTTGGSTAGGTTSGGTTSGGTTTGGSATGSTKPTSTPTKKASTAPSTKPATTGKVTTTKTTKTTKTTTTTVAPATSTGGTESWSEGGLTEAPGGVGVYVERAVWSGTVVHIRWNASGLDVGEFILEAGSAPSLSNVYNGSVGRATGLSAVTSLGVFYVRVRVRTTSGQVFTSNEISFARGSRPASGSSASGGCTAPPSAPTNVSGGVGSGQASVSWSPSPGATSYLVQAGSAHGLSNLFHGNVGPTVAVAAAVEAGFTAFVRVIAVNACGHSTASAEIQIQ